MKLKFSLRYLLLATMLALNGCVGLVSGPVIGFVKNDIDRANEIAVKYGDLTAAKCYTYLSNALANDPASEDAAGLISAIQISRVLRNQIDKNESAFKLECGPLAGEVVIEIARRARARVAN